MKRALLFVLILSAVVIALSSCTQDVNGNGNGHSGYQPSVYDLDFPTGDYTLADLIQTIDSLRYKRLPGSDYVQKFQTNYMNFNPDYANSITQAEALSLVTKRDRKESVSYAEARSDVDLYFRLLRYRLGHYDVLGGDTVFYAARDAVFAKLEAYKNTNISTSTLADIIVSELGFIDDCHFSVDGHQVYYEYNTATLKYETYLSGLGFGKDADGYYQLKDNEKYYYLWCEDENATMVPMLSSNGKLSYSLVLYCPPASKPASSTVALLGPELLEVTVHWKETTGKTIQDGLAYKETDNIAYVGLTGRSEYAEKQLYMLANMAKKKDIVIVDLRSNGGIHGYEFFRGYLDEDPTIDEVACVRIGMTNAQGLKPGEEHSELLGIPNGGVLHEGKNLTIVLVDNETGCAPEEFSEYFRFISNTIVIGTNTCGHLDGGTTSYGDWDGALYDPVYLHLPNTGMEIVASANLALYGDYESMVGKGFLPDLYVESTGKALESVVAMLADQGLISLTEAWEFVGMDFDPEMPMLYDADKAVEMTEKTSKYGTYYEARFTLTADNPIACFKWTNPDTSKPYRLEVVTKSPEYVWFDTSMYQPGHTHTGCDVGGILMKTCEPMRMNSNPVYGSLVLTGTEYSGSFDIVYRFFPTTITSDMGWSEFEIDENETRPLMELIEANAIKKVFSQGWYGPYSEWTNNPYI